MTPTQMAMVRSYVASNLANRFSTKDLADLVGMSRSHFCREWRLATGSTIMAYVRSQRVQAAIGMIETTPLKLSAIAADCGFASHAHMTDTIRQATGAQPSKLRVRRTLVALAAAALTLVLQEAA